MFPSGKDVMHDVCAGGSFLRSVLNGSECMRVLELVLADGRLHEMRKSHGRDHVPFISWRDDTRTPWAHTFTAPIVMSPCSGHFLDISGPGDVHADRGRGYRHFHTASSLMYGEMFNIAGIFVSTGSRCQRVNGIGSIRS